MWEGENELVVFRSFSGERKRITKAQGYRSLPCWRNSNEASVIRTECARRESEIRSEDVATALTGEWWRIFGTENSVL